MVLTNDRETKRLILKNIFASFFEKDVKVFAELKDVRELRDLILLLAAHDGNMLDISKLSSELSFYNKRNKSEVDFILNKEIAFEVKQKALKPDYKRLQSLAGEIGITRQYMISNTLSDVENTVYPWFL